MNKIELNNCLPRVFASNSNVNSELWLNDVTFTKGNKYMIKAESGKGKSSFCSYVMGYRNDYQGDIKFDEQSVRKFNISEWIELRKKSISYLPQGLMLFDELTALENILLKNDLTHHKSKEWIESSLDVLGIADRADFKVGKLSYGQKQRVAILRALCQPFDFMLLDEPISHIDDNTAKIVAKLLSDELSQNGASLIVTSIGKEMVLDYSNIIHL